MSSMLLVFLTMLLLLLDLVFLASLFVFFLFFVFLFGLGATAIFQHLYLFLNFLQHHRVTVDLLSLLEFLLLY